MAMNPTQWREFLGELSRAILALDVPENNDVNRPHFSPEIRASGYIGCAGATEAQIAAAEMRLGCVFPPSYRAFLSVSNGWPVNWHSVEPGKLWACDEIQWVREQDPNLVEIFGQYNHEVSAAEHLKSGRDENDDWGFRGQYVANLLSVSAHGDACDLLICPEVVDENGEWECWKISSWGGVNRWPSFEQWFRDVLEFHREQKSS